MTPNPLYTSPCGPKMFTQERSVNPMDPKSFEPSIAEILHALPNINRYNGHTTRPYSVAEHSINCMRAASAFYNITEDYLRLYILLHDAAEAYTQDIIRPIKRIMADDILLAEKEIMARLVDRLPFTYAQNAIVKSKSFQADVEEIDTRMAVTEMEEFFPQHANPLPDFSLFKMNLDCTFHFGLSVREVYKTIVDSLIQKCQRNLTIELMYKEDL